ncbi:putative bifunctional diguanylate cyclase/phosphodiesterase [Kitasatospora sp. NPDC048407]|uniref:putative bifunctional diguanylate cyclase/phosphodiesterase n=1 Tax=Kitasatospora sp. NPDC048407 TaxID=3364051 RepID=UPI0037193AEB
MNSTESVLPAHPALRRLTAVLLAVLCAGYAVGSGLGWGSCELALVMGDFGLAGAALAAALSCLAHGIAVGGHTRPAWLLFGLSSAVVAFGNGLWGWYEVVLGRPLPPDSSAEYPFLLFAPLAITGLLVLAQRPRNPAGWLCLMLDGWLVAGSLFTLSWSLALGRVAAGDGDDPLKLAIGLGYPVLDILLVGLVVGLNVRGRDRNRAAVHTAMIGLVVTVVCDALFTTPQFHSDYHSGELLDAGWFAGSLLLAWAPWSHTRRPSRQHPSTQGGPRRRVASTFSALTPYAAAAVCTAGILYNALGGRPLDRVMLAAASTVGLALIVRQGVMLLDNLSLAQELATKEAHFRSLVQGSSDVIMIAGPSGALSYVSPAALRVYNRDPEDLVGGNLLNLVHPEDVDRVLAEVRRILARSRGARFQPGEPSARVECRIRSGENEGEGEGEWLHVESTVNPYRDGLILNSRDITERVRLQAQLQHNAFHDPLTDLPNRALFAQRVRAALTAQGPAGTALAVLFLDLDGFKAVNDTAGHQVGDELLVQAARRLQAAVRTEDTVARFGGDEFAVLVRGRLGHPQVRDLAERIRAALSEPYWIGGTELGVAASIGIAFGPDAPLPVPDPAPGEDEDARARSADSRAASAADELLRNADLAMYQAKSRGKGRVVLYTPAMRAELDRRGELEERLRAAVREGSFALLHQPVVELAGGRLTGVEAQARWRSAEGLLLTPAEFLRTADTGDGATRFARWLVTEAVAAAARRRADGPAAPPVPVTVRLAAERLCAPGMYETLAGALRDTELPPDLLVLEVSRTGPDALADELGRRLAAFRRLGVSTALAGFGAGGGSLGALARMPFDALKLDRSLVQDIADSTLTRALAGHALRLGRDLGLVTGADGVDHPRQLAVLQELGCRRGQGLAFDRPLDELRLRRALLRRGYSVPRPGQGHPGRRPLLTPEARTNGLAEASAARPGHLHSGLELPQRHTVGGPSGGPHGETAVPPA